MGNMPPTLELLAYYRRRIEEFESERAEFLRKFKTVEVSNGFPRCCGGAVSPFVL